MEAEIYRFDVQSRLQEDPRSNSLLHNALALGFFKVEKVIYQDIYFLKGELSESDCRLLADSLFSDPTIQSATYSRVTSSHFLPPVNSDHYIVEAAYLPGVTDSVAEQIVRASQILGVRGVSSAATGQCYKIFGRQLDREYLIQISKQLLTNPIIQSFSLGSIQPVFPLPAISSGNVEYIAIQNMSSQELMSISVDRRAALDLSEMQAIQAYFCSENRDVTDLEFETIAQTWSEHCVHKSFKALIKIENPDQGDPAGQRNECTIDNLLKTYLRSATDQINPDWLRSAFVDNAGIIDFDSEQEVSFKVETHNHPSAIEPFGGANTGVGGVIRDVIGVSAKPIAATDVLCFGPPSTKFDDLPVGVLHPLRIRSGVISGVQDYGNKIGIPTVSGAILYDPGFTSNPLVFCGCVGIAPKDSHPRNPICGDHVIILGGRTGRDGLRGATFSSMTIDAQTGEVAGASVQIGSPIIEKGLIDVVVRARDIHLYHAITDCGAGGLSSAVGEMASECGADVELGEVKLKYSGLSPWEIWLSEAQERMVLAVPPSSISQLLELCEVYDVELTDIGVFTDTGRLVVRYEHKVLIDLDNTFLHHGIPQRKLSAILPTITKHLPPLTQNDINYTKLLLILLAHPDIASKENVIRIYDHEVQGGTVIKPLVGSQNDGPSDGVVIKPIGTTGSSAIVLGAGINPQFGKTNPYRMAISAVDESIRNIVATGGNPDHTAILDNFCWGDPSDPSTLGTLVDAVRGCHDAAIYYQTPFISGKDSLNNEYLGIDGQHHAIPPTLLISAISVINDLNATVTMDFKQAGNPVYLLGDFRPHLEGSHFSLVIGEPFYDGIPDLPNQAPDLYRKLFQAIGNGYVKACHDLSEGGLLVTAAEMCIGGRLGLELVMQSKNPPLTCFGETNGCFLIEVDKEYTPAFEQIFSDLPFKMVGAVNSQPLLSFRIGDQDEITVHLDTIIKSWKSRN